MQLTAIFISSLYVVASVYCILHEWLFQHISLTLLVFLWFCWFCPVCCTCISWRRCGRHDVSNNETVLSRFLSLIILYSPDAQTNWKHFLPLHWTVDKVAKRLKTPASLAKNQGNYVCIRHGLLKINQIKEMASQIFISNIDVDSGKYWTILTIQTIHIVYKHYFPLFWRAFIKFVSLLQIFTNSSIVISPLRLLSRWSKVFVALSWRKM